MTGTDLAQRATVQLTNEQLSYIANTEFVPRGLRGNVPAIMACVATGRELGIGDMMALKSIHVIDGSPSYSAELMVMLVRRAGHSITGKVGEGAATVVGTRVDTGDSMEATWTLAMAERAGLMGKQNWKRYPEAMLWARAVSQLCRMLFADCFAGGTYVPEELGDDGSGGEPQADEAPHGLATVSQDAGMGEPASPPDYFPPLPDEPPPEPITAPQKKKLNVLVGKLRPDHISTEDLWRSQSLDPSAHRDENGELHWSPLRDRLTKDSASKLIERLTGLEERVSHPDFAGRAAEAIAAREALDGPDA